MAGNVTSTRRILREHDAARGEATDVTIACLEFHLAREPDHQHAVRRVVPAYLAHARRDVTDVAARRRERVGEMERRVVFEKLPGL
jgi:hypothetical protein